MDKVTDRGIQASDSPTSAGQQDTTLDLDLEDITELEKDLEHRVQQIARWNPGEELILNHPRIGGIHSDVWRWLITGWLDDPLLAVRYSEAVRGLKLALRDFGDAEIAAFVRSLLGPNP